MSHRIQGNRPSIPTRQPSEPTTTIDAKANVTSRNTDSGEFAPVEANDPRLKYTICPFMSSALKNGLIGVDSKGRAEVEQLREVLGPFGKVTEFFARQNHAVDADGKLKESSKDDGIIDFLKINPTTEYFDPLHFAGSKGDHIGDTKILSVEKGFDAARFEAFVGHSSDGKTMTAEDFGKAMASFQPLDKEVDTLGERALNKSKSAGEWALMMGLLGKKDANGELRVDIQEMRNLFEKNEFPDGWRENMTANSTLAAWGGWSKNTSQILHHSVKSKPRDLHLQSTSDMASEAFRHVGPSGSALQGVEVALGKKDTPTATINSLQGAQKGVCPVGGDASAVTSNISAVKDIHQDR